MEPARIDLVKAWDHGFSWMMSGEVDSIIACSAMFMGEANGDEDETTRMYATVLSTLMISCAFTIGTTPRSLADTLFQGLPDSDQDWTKVLARITERWQQVADHIEESRGSDQEKDEQ